jgi:hypothetical protein
MTLQSVASCGSRTSRNALVVSDGIARPHERLAFFTGERVIPRLLDAIGTTAA